MNVILDALFILVFKWGIQGAAIATILSQLMALCWQFKLFSNKNELLHFKKGIYKLKRKLVDNILAIGISPFLMNVCACIIVIFINNQLVRFGGDLSVGAYGIANGIAMVFIMFVFGVNQGMQPIAGYNYGAQKTGPTDARIEPEYHCRHRHHGNGLADSHVPALLLRTTVYYRQDADRLGHQGHQSSDVLLPGHRVPDGHHQLLPVHRKGEDQYLPLPVETVAHPSAAPGFPADDMGH